MPILGRGCRRFLPFALLALLLGTTARADALDARGRGDVTRLGPDGMRSALVAVARDGSTIWLGEGGSGASSVLVSTDGGRTFARSQAPVCGVLDDLTAHPSDAASAWILCDNQLFVTEDRGALWRRNVAVHPSVFRWLDLVVLPDASVFLHRQGGLFRLDPGGLVLVLADDVLGADGGPDGSLWALTAAGLRRSRDRGASWTLVSSEQAQYGWIVVDPANSERVLVWTDRAKRLERSEDGGVSFRRIGPALEWLAPPRFGRGPILFTSSLVERGVGLGAGVSMVSHDLGRSWSPIPGLPSQSFGELAVDPLRPWHAVWAPGGATALGVWVSTDGYRSWVPRGSGLDGLTVSEFAPSADRQSAWAVVAGVFGDRLYGLTAEGWRRAGLHESPGSVASVAADAVAPGTAWAASSRGLLVTHDAGDSWEALSQSDTVWRAQLHAHPRVGGALFLIEQPIIYPIERLQRSIDGGLTFSDTGFDLDDAQRIVAPVGSPARLGLTGVQCSGSRSCDGRQVAAESTDDGATWKRLRIPGDEVAFAWAPQSDVALVATSRGLFRRTLPPRFNRLDARRYLDLVAGERTLYALILTPSGVVRIKTSDDAGNTWRALGAPFDPPRAPQRLEVIPGDPDTLYALGPGGVLQVALE